MVSYALSAAYMRGSLYSYLTAYAVIYKHKMTYIYKQT